MNPSSDHFHTNAVVPSSDYCRTGTVLPPSDHYCIKTVPPCGDYGIAIVVPSSDHCCTESVPSSSDHYSLSVSHSPCRAVDILLQCFLFLFFCPRLSSAIRLAAGSPPSVHRPTLSIHAVLRLPGNYASSDI